MAFNEATDNGDDRCSASAASIMLASYELVQ